jgi:hypothetical protein
MHIVSHSNKLTSSAQSISIHLDPHAVKSLKHMFKAHT